MGAQVLAWRGSGWDEPGQGGTVRTQESSISVSNEGEVRRRTERRRVTQHRDGVRPEGSEATQPR